MRIFIFTSVFVFFLIVSLCLVRFSDAQQSDRKTRARSTSSRKTSSSPSRSSDEILDETLLARKKNGNNDDENNNTYRSSSSSSSSTTVEVDTAAKLEEPKVEEEKNKNDDVVTKKTIEEQQQVNDVPPHPNNKPSPADNKPSSSRSHSHPENLPHNHNLMQPSTHPDAFFQADHVSKAQKMHKDDKQQAMSDIVQSQGEKRNLERQRHPAASQEYIDLHGQRVSIATLRAMCHHLKVDHLPFLNMAAGRELELSTLFAANRLAHLFEAHKVEKRLRSIEEISCVHGVQIAKSDEATKVFELISETQREGEGIRLHLLDLADAWTITQTKDSDLVEEVVASLGYYTALSRIGNPLNQKLSFLRSEGAVTSNDQCNEMVQGVAKLVKEIPEGVPNWTHMRVGAEMLLQQCDMEPSLASGDL